MNLEDATAALQRLRTARPRDGAVHQPVTLIWAACRAARGEPRLVRWADVKDELAQVIGGVSAARTGGAPEYPILALRTSPLWELESAADAPLAHSSMARRWLDGHNPRFGLSSEAFDLLRNAESVRNTFAAAAVTALDPLRADAVLRWFAIDVPVFRGFGEVPGVSVGQVFDDRAALSQAKVHRANVAGIVGTAATGAESIVVSGGYEDDEDYGDLLVYTGHGGNDPNTKRQVADQDPAAPGNAALITSRLTGMPIRVVRGADPRNPYAPDRGYRYDGLYNVDLHWQQRGRSGYRVCRFRLIRTQVETAVALALPDAPGRARLQGNTSPGRSAVLSNRIIRSATMSEAVKRLHDYRCQVCDVRLILNGRGYAEGAHIRPLGRPHDGPDIPENLLCLCPNCHVLFDNGAILIQEDLSVRSAHPHRARLRLAPGHDPGSQHLAYHRMVFER